jgi:hypothetical protein
MGIVVTPAPASVSAQATILDWPAIVVPNLASLERISTDPNNGGPYCDVRRHAVRAHHGADHSVHHERSIRQIAGGVVTK